MPSHVNNQKLQPRFQRVSGHRSRVSHLRLCAIDRPPLPLCMYMPCIIQIAAHICVWLHNSCAHIPHRSFIALRSLQQRILRSDTVAWSRELIPIMKHAANEQLRKDGRRVNCPFLKNTRCLILKKERHYSVADTRSRLHLWQLRRQRDLNEISLTFLSRSMRNDNV